MRFIGEDLAAAEDNLAAQFGFAEAGRIVEDLTAFRARTMRPPPRRSVAGGLSPWPALPVPCRIACAPPRRPNARPRAGSRAASRARLTELLRLGAVERMAHLDDPALTGPDRVSLRRSIQGAFAKPQRRGGRRADILARGDRLSIALLRGVLHPFVLVLW